LFSFRFVRHRALDEHAIESDSNVSQQVKIANTMLFA